jgi:ribosome assembly protein RRB1
MRLTRLKKTRRKEKADDDSEDDDDSSSDEEGGDGGPAGGKADQPVLQVQTVTHHGGVNRVRCCPQRPAMCASWGDTGVVQVWDLTPQLQHLMALTAGAYTRPLFSST